MRVMSKKERLGMGWGVLVGSLYVVLIGLLRTVVSIDEFYRWFPRAYHYQDYFGHSLQRFPKIAFSLLTLVGIITAILYSFQGKCKKAKWSLLICITSWMCYVLFRIIDWLLENVASFNLYNIFFYNGFWVLDDILMLVVVMVLLFLLPKLQKKGLRVACGVGVVALGLFFVAGVYFVKRESMPIEFVVMNKIDAFIVANIIDFVLGSLPYLFFAIFVSESLLKSEPLNRVQKDGAKEAVVTKFCSSCGNLLSAGALFCASCGARCMRKTKPRKNCFLLSAIACGLNAIIVCILPLYCRGEYDIGGRRSIAWFFSGAGCLHYGFKDDYVVFGILLLFVLGSIMGIYFTKKMVGDDDCGKCVSVSFL